MGARADVIVLGAGMVGVSVALHLQKRGRDVVLVDRREPGEETSYGNAGLIQREAVFPYTSPQLIPTGRNVSNTLFGPIRCPSLVWDVVSPYSAS
jgi:glycine/D-amino acid oxidase-like deaminating enzyme